MRPLLLIIASLLMVGCAATTTVHRPPGHSLKGKKIYFVDHNNTQASDDFNNILVQSLKARGLTVTTNKTAKVPEDAQEIVYYYVVWFAGKDPDVFKLDIRIKDAVTGYTVAKAKTYHPYNRRTDTQTAVDETLDAIFASPDNNEPATRNVIGETVHSLFHSTE
ncbi:MAG: hypothetical protein ABIP97_14355 [Chthoniobacterales bacterium]